MKQASKARAASKAMRADMPHNLRDSRGPPTRKTWLCEPAESSARIGGATAARPRSRVLEQELAAVRLVRLGIHVHLARFVCGDTGSGGTHDVEAGVSDKITVKRGDAAQLADNFFRRDRSISFFAITFLEYFDDPGAVLRGAVACNAGFVGDTVRPRTHQAGEVLRRFSKRRFGRAEHNLTVEWGQESLNGGRVRLFSRRPQAIPKRRVTHQSTLGGECALSRITCRHRFLDRRV